MTSMGYADPVAQRRIEQLEAENGRLLSLLERVDGDAFDRLTKERDELRDGEVLVGDSWFKRSDLPTVLGNFMRSSAEYAQEAKALHIERDELRATYGRDGVDGHACIRVEAYEAMRKERDELRAKVARVEAVCDVWATANERHTLFKRPFGFAIRRALGAHLPPSEPSSLPTAPAEGLQVITPEQRRLLAQHPVIRKALADVSDNPCPAPKPLPGLKSGGLAGTPNDATGGAESRSPDGWVRDGEGNGYPFWWGDTIRFGKGGLPKFTIPTEESE